MAKIHESYRDLHKAARKQGWTITTTSGGHLRWLTPDGRSVFSPVSPSDCRGRHRVIMKLKAAGLVVR